MEGFLGHPAVQAVLAPFAAGLAVAFALAAVRLSGLAVAAGLAAALALIGGFAFPPVSAQQKVLLLALAAPALGVIADLAFRPARAAAPVLGAMFGLATVWVAWNFLRQKELAMAVAAGAGLAALAGWITAAFFALRTEPVRAGAAALAFGVGAGASALLSAAASYGQYAMALGSGAGAFLLAQLVLGRTLAAGATLTLGAGVGGGLIATGTLLGAQLPWYAALALALVPVAVRLPLPRAGLRVQTLLAALYGGIVAAIACLLSWPGVQERLGL